MKTTKFYGVDFEWDGITLKASGVYTAGLPAKISGPPEKCYPAEPSEVEITVLTCEEDDAKFLLDGDHADAIHEALIEKLEE